MMMKAILTALALVLAGAGCAQAQEAWGAIYFSPNSHATGYSFDYDTEGAADDAAASYCGQADCIEAISFYDSCGALAVGASGGWGADWGDTEYQAEDNAVAICSQYDNDCRVLRWQCT